MAPRKTGRAPKASPTKEDAPAMWPKESPQPHANAAASADEMEALKAIYMEDFHEVETKGAWSKTTDRILRLRLRSISEQKISVVLCAHITIAYPKTVPLLSFEEDAHLHQTTRQKLQDLLRTKPKELVGQVMLHHIADDIRDILEIEAALRNEHGTLPSLEEERARHAAAAEELAKQEAADMQRKHEEEQAEEERALNRKVENDFRRKESLMRKKSRTAVGKTPRTSFSHDASGQVSFDRKVSIHEEGSTAEFSSVDGMLNFKSGPVTTQYLVKPIGLTAPALVLKRVRVGNLESTDSAQLKSGIMKFEEEMESLKKLRHNHFLSVYDFKIETLDGAMWDINILVPLANKGSLREKLEDDEDIPVEKVRSWMIELLEALDFYHRQNLVHKRIHPGNVLLCKPHGGGVAAKLADSVFQGSLHALKPSKANATRKPRPLWVAVELSQEPPIEHTRKTDIWDLGVTFLQMLFGLEAPAQHESPNDLSQNLGLSAPLQDFIEKFFRSIPKRRPTAFDLTPCEFLRKEVPVYESSSPAVRRRQSASALGGAKSRRGSFIGYGGSSSRYATDWVEAGRLGKGAFGEVVRARNRTDGHVYAIKKIRQKTSSALTEVLSEVRLLSRLNHPYVVRYYTAWPEEDTADAQGADDDTPESSFNDESDGYYESDAPRYEDDDSIDSLGSGLDFIDSSGYPDPELPDEDYTDAGGFIFAPDSDSDESNKTETPQRTPGAVQYVGTSSRPAQPMRSILYIQMELCENQTLRDLIVDGLPGDSEQYWRLLRQILEGLGHIHSQGFIHRDLKPDNVFIDIANIPKIGDFGLAKSGQYHGTEQATGAVLESDMTRDLGTPLYAAPESTVGASYNNKVDMYAVGITFLEMCYPLKTAMERGEVVVGLREQHVLPVAFSDPEMALQAHLVLSLTSLSPDERPSCDELLRSEQLPHKIEDEAVKEVLKAFSDHNSPHYRKIMAAFFAQKPDDQVKDHAWEDAAGASASSITNHNGLLQSLVKERLAAVFRRHGAVDIERQLLLPWSNLYAGSNAVKLFDPSGTLVQLPFDLTLPFVRSIARATPMFEKSFAIGNVYRVKPTGGAPRRSGEADFDIVSCDSVDLALKEAEVLKVIDEMADEFPPLSSTPICFHLNHSNLMDMVLDSCRIAIPQRPAVKRVLSKLNIHKATWAKIRNELRAPDVGLSSTSIGDLAHFDWREAPEKAHDRLRQMFNGTEYVDKIDDLFAHLHAVVSYMKHWNIQRKVYISPLSGVNEQIYSGGVLFQCLLDTNHREVLAAGGRYDRLIYDHRPRGLGQPTAEYHGVGMNLAWERLVQFMARYIGRPPKPPSKKSAESDATVSSWTPRRCDCLVASFDPSILRSAGVRTVALLIAHGYSAELAGDCRSPEELISRYRDDKHSWIVIIKQNFASDKPDVKLKSMEKKVDTDIRSADLLNHLRNEFRDRELREGASAQRPPAFRAPPTPTVATSPMGPKASVEVLMASHRSKKVNKWSVVDAAQTRSAELLASFQSAPIAAIETKDEVMSMIRETRLNDSDSWKRVIQSLPLADRKYVQELQALLHKFAGKWKEEKGSAGTSRSVEGGKAFVYNFRTGACLLYDLEG